MMKAAMMGAIAFQKGLGACHSLAHPLSSEHGLQHGLANALCLPRWSPSTPARSRSACGAWARCWATQRRREGDRARRARVGIHGGLAGVGIREEQLLPLSKKALEDACHRSNPRPCSETELLELYRASL